MKTKNLFGILMLFLFTFTFISCDKEDEEGRKMVHPTFRVIRQSCRAYNLSLK